MACRQRHHRQAADQCGERRPDARSRGCAGGARQGWRDARGRAGDGGQGVLLGRGSSKRHERWGRSPKRSINPLYDQAVRLFSTELPIVAAVQGAAIGAGLGLALVADFRVAAPEARFAANFTKLGFHPGFGLTYTLPRLIGRQHAAGCFSRASASMRRRRWRWGWWTRWRRWISCWCGRSAGGGDRGERAAGRALDAQDVARRVGGGVRAATDHEFTEQQWLMKTDDFRRV